MLVCVVNGLQRELVMFSQEMVDRSTCICFVASSCCSSKPVPTNATSVRIALRRPRARGASESTVLDPLSSPVLTIFSSSKLVLELFPGQGGASFNSSSRHLKKRLVTQSTGGRSRGTLGPVHLVVCLEDRCYDNHRHHHSFVFSFFLGLHLCHHLRGGC